MCGVRQRPETNYPLVNRAATSFRATLLRLHSTSAHIIIAICVTSSDMVLKSFYFGEGRKEEEKQLDISVFLDLINLDFFVKLHRCWQLKSNGGKAKAIEILLGLGLCAFMLLPCLFVSVDCQKPVTILVHQKR